MMILIVFGSSAHIVDCGELIRRNDGVVPTLSSSDGCDQYPTTPFMCKYPCMHAAFHVVPLKVTLSTIDVGLSFV